MTESRTSPGRTQTVPSTRRPPDVTVRKSKQEQRKRTFLRKRVARPRTQSKEPLDLAAARKQLANFCKWKLGNLLNANSAAAPWEAASAAPAVPLPHMAPRVRQTLDRLLAGDSEKQIARQLNVSPHTVHVYIKTLYRLFSVNSRGELLARFVLSNP